MKKANTKTGRAGLRTAKKKTIAHHAKRVWHLTPKFVHGMVAGAFVGLMVVVALRATQPVSALNITSPRDCDSNAVINCGALTTAELKQRYGNKGVSIFYNYFGISAQDINSMDTIAVAGQVYKNGTITVGSTTVATGAITAGRQNIAGSTKVTSAGLTFYKRPPSVSFKPNSIAAFVVMQNGQFRFAILGACGNPVSGNPVAKTVPPPQTITPTPVPPATEVPETPVVPTTSTQTPPSTPTALLASTPTSLPQTGPGAVLIIALLSVIGGYIFHATHRHIRRHATKHHPHTPFP